MIQNGNDEESWTDLYRRLSEERLLFLGDEVNSEISNQSNGLMIFLSLQDPRFVSVYKFSGRRGNIRNPNV